MTKREPLPKGTIVIECPECKTPRDYSHLPQYVTDWYNLIPLLEVEPCPACALTSLEIVCVKTQVYKRRVK